MVHEFQIEDELKEAAAEESGELRVESEDQAEGGK